MNYKVRAGYNDYYIELKSPSKSKKPKMLLILTVGAVIGFINGFWGGGGGMICVAALIHVLKLQEKKAHATTILIILPLCIASFIIYLFNGAVNFGESWPVMVGFVAGGIAGAYLLKKLNNQVLMIIFTVLIIAGGIKLVI